MVALWVLATVLATAVAWWAVAVVGGRGGGSEDGVLSAGQVDSALREHRALATSSPTPPPTVLPSVAPSPPPATTPTAGPTTSPPSVLDVVRTWDVDGGQVSATCRATTIGLLYATASDGWAVETKSAGPAEIEVELKRRESETKVRARCVDGIPTLMAESEDDGGDT